MSKCTIWKNNMVALTAEGFHFNEYKSEGLHKKHAAEWKPSQHSLKGRGKPIKSVSR
jgi:hypothetical protein